MTDNGKIAIWAGWTHDEVNILKHWMAWIEPDGITRHNLHPNYCTKEQDAISLIQILKERGYWFMLGTETDELDMLTGEYRFKIVSPQGKQVNVYSKTIAGAISSAILQLIADET